jgi:hypothetical protein
VIGILHGWRTKQKRQNNSDFSVGIYAVEIWHAPFEKGDEKSDEKLRNNRICHKYILELKL